MSRRHRPIPDDFATFAVGKSISELRRHYATSDTIIVRWRRACGIVPTIRPGPRPDRGLPDDFAEVARGKPMRELCRIYRRSTTTISRWRQEASVPAPTTRGFAGKRDTPEGFADLAPRLTVVHLMARFGCARSTITRWCREHGLTPKPPTISYRGPGLAPSMQVAVRDGTLAGRAADFLRKFGPVIRCDETGAYNPRGTHWRRNSTILTADAVIQRAASQGFDPDDWRKVGAPSASTEAAL